MYPIIPESVYSGQTSNFSGMSPFAELDVYSGGTAVSATLNGGLIDVFSGGTASHVTVTGGGVAYVAGGTVVDLALAAGGATIASGGLIAGATILNPAILYISSGTALSLIVTSGGGVVEEVGGTINGAFVANSGAIAVQGGTLTGALVDSGVVDVGVQFTGVPTSSTIGGSLSGTGVILVDSQASLLLSGTNATTGGTRLASNAVLELATAAAAGTGPITLTTNDALILDAGLPGNVLSGFYAGSTNQVQVRGINRGLVGFSAVDVLSAASALNMAINAAVSSGTLTPLTYASGTTAPAPSTGLGALVIATRPASTLAVPTTDAVVEVQAIGPVAITGGAAAASVFAGNYGLTYTNITPSGPAVAQIVAGDGSNFIQTATVGGGSINIATGAGNDTVGVLTGNATINAGTGSNLIVLGGGAGAGNSFVYSEGADSIVGNIMLGGGGSDTVNVGSGQSVINPGSSSFFVYGDLTLNPFTYLPGTGSATVAAGIGTSTITGGLAGNNLLIGGLSATGTLLTGGGAGDQLFAVGGGQVRANAGPGVNVTITGAGGITPLLPGFTATKSTANNVFTAGSGNDTLLSGAGSDTLVGGSGGATMVAGSGPEVFQFTNGASGGSDLITGFKPNDVLRLSGYGLTPATADALQANVGGSTLLTLSDGTRITLQGVPSLGLANTAAS